MTVLKPDPEPCVLTKCIVGTAAQNVLQGQVCLLTGGSRGIGKGIATELARAGAIVYVTGRSTAKETTDTLLAGSVDETAAGLNKLSGTGVALHADHAQMPDNRIVADMIEKQHGKLDCLINNAFFIPKPDKLFFSSRLWNQPTRFLNEQIAVGSHNHAAMTMLLVGALRRGKGCVINVTSWGSQSNIPIFPTSYLVNKAAFDGTTMALNEMLMKYNICSICLWPGNIRSERSTLAAKRTGDRLSDNESTRFTGRCVAGILDMPAEEMMTYAKMHGTVVVADFNMEKYGGHDVDGYKHEKHLMPYFTSRPVGASASYLLPRGMEQMMMTPD